MYLGVDDLKQSHDSLGSSRDKVTRKWHALLGLSLIPSITRAMGLHNFHNPASLSQAVLPKAILPSIPRNRLPTKPDYILGHWSFLLTRFEVNELQTCNQVYYVSYLPYWTRQMAALRDITRTKGYPTFEIGDQIAFRYEVLEKYHVSILCKDVKTNLRVEIKARTKDYPQDLIEYELEALHLLRGS